MQVLASRSSARNRVWRGEQFVADHTDDFAVQEVARQRFNEMLELWLASGLTQAQIAAKAGVQPQYLSDIKRGERRLSELIARRLEAEFGVNHRWLMGIDDTREATAPASMTAASGNTVRLPLLPTLIEGAPRANSTWIGGEIELVGAAAGKAALATDPYVLQWRHSDKKGRLKKDDLILISQTPNPDAEIQIVNYRNKIQLVRIHPDGKWRRVVNGTKFSADCPATGHCIGIIWSALV